LQSAPPVPRARVKPWLDEALDCISPYLRQLSDEEKDVLFRAIRNNVRRIVIWRSSGNFSSLTALRAKINDWQRRGI
jgi:hypothetical protein